MTNKQRLIDVTPLIDECTECAAIEWNQNVYTTWAEAEEDFKQRLLDAPVVDAVEVVHGRNLKAEWPSLFECSVCDCDSIDTYSFEPSAINYCPNCGAKMDLED